MSTVANNLTRSVQKREGCENERMELENIGAGKAAIRHAKAKETHTAARLNVCLAKYQDIESIVIPQGDGQGRAWTKGWTR
jgi:hypothetical protein